MFSQKPQNATWGKKPLQKQLLIITAGDFLYGGKRFFVEASGIHKGLAYVRLSPSDQKITEMLIEQIEKYQSINLDDLLKTLAIA